MWWRHPMGCVSDSSNCVPLSPSFQTMGCRCSASSSSCYTWRCPLQPRCAHSDAIKAIFLTGTFETGYDITFTSNRHKQQCCSGLLPADGLRLSLWHRQHWSTNAAGATISIAQKNCKPRKELGSLTSELKLSEHTCSIFWGCLHLSDHSQASLEKLHPSVPRAARSKLWWWGTKQKEGSDISLNKMPRRTLVAFIHKTEWGGNTCPW